MKNNGAGYYILIVTKSYFIVFKSMKQCLIRERLNNLWGIKDVKV